MLVTENQRSITVIRALIKLKYPSIELRLKTGRLIIKTTVQAVC